MVTNKAIIGFIAVLILVIGSIIFIRRNPTLLSRLGRTTTPTVTPTRAPGTTTNGGSTVTPVPGSQGQHLGLTACSAEMMNSCNDDTPVCGYERVEAEGSSTTRQLTFKSSCAYCKLYGSEGVLNLGEEKYYPLGYSVGSCTATK